MPRSAGIGRQVKWRCCWRRHGRPHRTQSWMSRVNRIALHPANQYSLRGSSSSPFVWHAARTCRGRLGPCHLRTLHPRTRCRGHGPCRRLRSRCPGLAPCRRHTRCPRSRPRGLGPCRRHHTLRRRVHRGQVPCLRARLGQHLRRSGQAQSRQGTPAARCGAARTALQPLARCGGSCWRPYQDPAPLGQQPVRHRAAVRRPGPWRCLGRAPPRPCWRAVRGAGAAAGRRQLPSRLPLRRCCRAPRRRQTASHGTGCHGRARARQSCCAHAHPLRAQEGRGRARGRGHGDSGTADRGSTKCQRS